MYIIDVLFTIINLSIKKSIYINNLINDILVLVMPLTCKTQSDCTALWGIPSHYTARFSIYNKYKMLY